MSRVSLYIGRVTRGVFSRSELEGCMKERLKEEEKRGKEAAVSLKPAVSKKSRIQADRRNRFKR